MRSRKPSRTERGRYAAPGLLLVGAHRMDGSAQRSSARKLAAQQWWGNRVAAASPSDVWVTVGWCATLKAVRRGFRAKSALNKALEDFLPSAR